MPVNTMGFRETFVRKSKVSSKRGFTSPVKPTVTTNRTTPNAKRTPDVKQEKKAKLEVNKKSKVKVDKKDDESIFELGDQHFGAFGDMQSDDDDYEEISIDSIFNEDNPSESSEYSEQTVDEEEYELYMNTINIHQIQDFEEWRNSEHFPLHLFHSDGEYDEITVDSDEFQQSLSNGGLVIDWTGTRVTLDTFNEKHEEEKKEKKKTTKIKVKKKKSKSSSKSSSDKKKKRKSEKRGKSTKNNRSSASSKLSNDEDDSRGSSLFFENKEGTKRNLSKERSKKKSSKVSLEGSSNSLTLMDLNAPSTPPIASPSGVVRKRQSKKNSKSRHHSSESGSQVLNGGGSDGTGSMTSSFEMPESMRNLRVSKKPEAGERGKDGLSKNKSSTSSDYPLSPRQPSRASMTGSIGKPKSPKLPTPTKSPHARGSPAGRGGGRKSASKAQLWADSMAVLNKPELGKSTSTATMDSGNVIPRRSSSRRQPTQSPKKRRSSTDTSLGALNISRRSRRNSAETNNSPIPRRFNSSSPISRRSSSRRRILNNNKLMTGQELDINSEHVGHTQRSGHRRSLHERKNRRNSLGELEQSGRLTIAREKLANFSLDDSVWLANSNNKNRDKPEKRKSDRLLFIEHMARGSAEQKKEKRSISALERRKGSHAAVREKLAKAGKSKSNRSMKQQHSGDDKPRRASFLDSSKKRDRRRGGKSGDTSTEPGRSDDKAAKKSSSSLGATGESRRMLRTGKKRESTTALQAAGSGSVSSLDSSPNLFDPFDVAVDVQNKKNTSFADTSDRVVDISERSGRSINHGRGPVSLLSRLKPSFGRKKVSKRRSSGNNAPLKRNSLQERILG